MSTSLLYHAFAVRGYRYVKTEYIEGGVIFTVEQLRKSYRCSVCGSGNVVKRGHSRRKFRTVSIGSRLVYIVLDIPRVQCRCCHKVRQVKIDFADPRVTYTKSFQQTLWSFRGT
jgi:transposase